MLRTKNQVFFMPSTESFVFSQTLSIHEMNRFIIFFYRCILSFLQALLQMEDIPSAISALQFYANAQPSIRYA